MLSRSISAVTTEYVESNGFSIVREYVGHGIGTQMHESPEIPNYGHPGHGPKLLRGMTVLENRDARWADIFQNAMFIGIK